MLEAPKQDANESRHGLTASRLVYLAQVALNAALLLIGVVFACMGSRRALLLLGLVPVAFVPFSYARRRLQRVLELHLPPVALWTVTAIGLFCDVIMCAQIFDARSTPGSALLQNAAVGWIGAVWFSSHALLAIGYGFGGLGRLAARLTRRVFFRSRMPEPQGEVVLLGRREFLQKAGLAGAALPFGVSLGNVPLTYDFRVERREITLPHWPPALDGLRVVHLSDIHVGGAMNLHRLMRVAELTNECRPDLVLHTGDFLTHRSGDFDEPLYAALSRIEAPYGHWACLGNHDYEDPERLARRLSGSGVTVLRNRTVRIPVRGQDLEIAGLDFVFGPRRRSAAYRRILTGWGERAGRPRILLNHDPTAFDELPPDCADIVLSGHTHGGHVGVQLDSHRAITVVGLAGLPDQGLFTRGDMRLYVTRCVGFYGYPMRLGIPPEIAVLTLRAPETPRASSV